jgi:AcrR family transcriptional regulator
MAVTGKPRTRRNPDEARRLILEAAEKRLAAGGPDAVRVQHVAADLGISDAAIYHHFTNRDGLLDALARFGARNLKQAMDDVLARFDGDREDIDAIASLALETFERRGYARLILWLSMAGIPADRGSGMFDSLGEAFERRLLAASPKGTSKAVAAREARSLAVLLVMVVSAEPLHGSLSRRSLGLAGNRAGALEFRRWFTGTLQSLLEKGAA